MKIIQLTLAIIFIVILQGCSGYKMGHIMHPQVKSIAIAQIDNNSSEPFVATYLKQALAEQFQVDGSLKLEDLRNADCILYAKVLNVETTGIGQDSANSQTTYRPASWSVSVEFEWTVLIPGRAEPLISRQTITQSGTYEVFADNLITRSNGIKQACRAGAISAVTSTTEAW